MVWNASGLHRFTITTNDLSKAIDFDQYVRMKLTDATDDGGLPGIRF